MRLMIEPVALQDFFLAFFSAAMTVVMGALYALLFALGKLRQSRGLLSLSYGAYVFLVAAVLLLAQAVNLSGAWQVLVGALLLGYLWAPHGIWHLCVGTHA